MIKKIMLALIVCCVLLLSGCTQVTPEPIIEQESLLQKCSADTPIPTEFVLDENGDKMYSGAEVYKVLLKWHFFYNTCAVMHDKLVDTIVDLQFDRMMILQKEE